MASLERHIMNQTASGESTGPLTTDEFAEKHQKFMIGTGLPGDHGTGRAGDELDAMTGEIQKHTDIIDAIEGLVSKIGMTEANPDIPAERKPLSHPKLART